MGSQGKFAVTEQSGVLESALCDDDHIASRGSTLQVADISEENVPGEPNWRWENRHQKISADVRTATSLTSMITPCIR
jgi:hypothetical protein